MILLYLYIFLLFAQADFEITAQVNGTSFEDLEARISSVESAFASAMSIAADDVTCSIISTPCKNDPDGVVEVAFGMDCATALVNVAGGDCDTDTGTGLLFRDYCPYTCGDCCGDDPEDLFQTQALLDAGLALDCATMLALTGGDCSLTFEALNPDIAAAAGITGTGLTVADVCIDSCGMCSRRNLASDSHRRDLSVTASCTGDDPANVLAGVGHTCTSIVAAVGCTPTLESLNPALAGTDLGATTLEQLCQTTCNVCCVPTHDDCTNVGPLQAQQQDLAGVCGGTAQATLGYADDSTTLVKELCPWECLESRDGCCVDDPSGVVAAFGYNCAFVIGAFTCDGELSAIGAAGKYAWEVCPLTCGYCVPIIAVDKSFEVNCVVDDNDGAEALATAGTQNTHFYDAVTNVLAADHFTQYYEVSDVYELNPEGSQYTTMTWNVAGFGDSEVCSYKSLVGNFVGVHSDNIVMTNTSIPTCVDDALGLLAAQGLDCPTAAALVGGDCYADTPWLVKAWELCPAYCNICTCEDNPLVPTVLGIDCPTVVGAVGGDCTTQVNALPGAEAIPSGPTIRTICPESCGCQDSTNFVTFTITSDFTDDVATALQFPIYNINYFMVYFNNYISAIETGFGVSCTYIKSLTVDEIETTPLPVEPVAADTTWPADTFIDSELGACEKQCFGDWDAGISNALDYEAVIGSQYASYAGISSCEDAFYEMVFLHTSVDGRSCKDVYLSLDSDKPRLYDYCCDYCDSDKCIDDPNKVEAAVFALTNDTATAALARDNCGLLLGSVNCDFFLPTGYQVSEVCCATCAANVFDGTFDMTGSTTDVEIGGVTYKAYEGYIFYSQVTELTTSNEYAFCDTTGVSGTARFPNPTSGVPYCRNTESGPSCSGCDAEKTSECVNNDASFNLLLAALAVDADGCVEGMQIAISDYGIGCDFEVPVDGNPLIQDAYCCAFCCASCDRSWNTFYVEQYVDGYVLLVDELQSLDNGGTLFTAKFYADGVSISLDGVDTDVWTYYTARTGGAFGNVMTEQSTQGYEDNTDTGVVTIYFMTTGEYTDANGNIEYVMITWETKSNVYEPIITAHIVSANPIPVASLLPVDGVTYPDASDRACSSASDCTTVTLSRCASDLCEPCVTDSDCDHFGDPTMGACVSGQCMDICDYARSSDYETCLITALIPIANLNLDCYDVGPIIHDLTPTELCDDCLAGAIEVDPLVFIDDPQTCLIAGLQLDIQYQKCKTPASNNTLGDRFYCRHNANCNCQHGEGGCLDDTDCADGLSCMIGAGRLFGFGFYENGVCVYPEDLAKCEHQLTLPLDLDTVDEVSNWEGLETSPSDDFQEQLNTILAVVLIALIVIVIGVLCAVQTGICASNKVVEKGRRYSNEFASGTLIQEVGNNIDDDKL